jgi:flagellar hook-basal body complex protein FliE
MTGAGPDAAGGADGQVSFKDVLMKNLNEVNQLQQDADKSLDNFVSGKSQNMGEVISASQKASMAFSMLTQIRNKLQDAYDEVKNLRI